MNLSLSYLCDWNAKQVGDMNGKKVCVNGSGKVYSFRPVTKYGPDSTNKQHHF